MTIADLIARLELFNTEIAVHTVSASGFVVEEVGAVWMSRDGRLMLSPSDAIIGTERVRPDWAPSKQIEEFWEARNQDDV